MANHRIRQPRKQRDKTGSLAAPQLERPNRKDRGCPEQEPDHDLVKLRRRALFQPRDRIVINGQSLINFGSNDYLGLAADSRIAAAVRTALDEEGWGAGASPLVTGRSELHARLEHELATFEGTEAALLFPSGYAA